MKALSIHPGYAMAIVLGEKTVECRTWKTDYRGDILICSTAKKQFGTIPGHALGVVTLTDIVPFTKNHLKAACMDYMPDGDAFAWLLKDYRLIKPIPLKGRLSLWNYDGPIEYIPDDMIYWDNETDPGPWYKKYWEPIMIK